MPDEKQVTLHRISKVDEDRIYELVNTRLRINAGDSAAVRKQKEKKKELFDAFLLKITPHRYDKPRAEGPRRLCYEHIDEIVEITGISYLEILKAVSKDPSGNPVEPRWASETEAAMCSCCDLMADEQKEAVLALIQRIIATVYLSKEINEEPSSIQRLCKTASIRNYSLKVMTKQTIDLGVHELYLSRNLPYNHNVIELNLISYMAYSFDVSPHWLLNLDESKTILASSGKTEKIMDVFCFLPNERKEMILKAAEAVITEEGAL